LRRNKRMKITDCKTDEEYWKYQHNFLEKIKSDYHNKTSYLVEIIPIDEIELYLMTIQGSYTITNLIPILENGNTKAFLVSGEQISCIEY